MTDLLPCPFCGKPAKRYGSNLVGCEDTVNCGGEVDWGHYIKGDGPVDAWNRRADIAQARIDAAVEAERRRCYIVVSAARNGDIDGDFRALQWMISSGEDVDYTDSGEFLDAAAIRARGGKGGVG
jgi:hypothetical protein